MRLDMKIAELVDHFVEHYVEQFVEHIVEHFFRPKSEFLSINKPLNRWTKT
jgi:hypothetical protein